MGAAQGGGGLMVGQPRRRGGRALVEAVFAQLAAEQLVLEARYARFEIRRAFLARGNWILLTALVMLDGDGGRRGAIRLSARGRPIGRLERIELDSVDRPLAFPAVDRALDYVAQLADIAGPAIFDQRVGRLGAEIGRAHV